MPEHAEKVVNKKQLLALIKESNATKTEVGELTGSLAERIKKASDDGHLHKGAFAIVCKLSRMEELKRRDFLRQLPLYIDMCTEGGLFGSEHVGDLVADAENEPAADDGGDPDVRPQFLKDSETAAKANGEALEAGIKPLDEEKPKRRAPKPQGLEGAEGSGSYRVQ